MNKIHRNLTEEFDVINKYESGQVKLRLNTVDYAYDLYTAKKDKSFHLKVEGIRSALNCINSANIDVEGLPSITVVSSMQSAVRFGSPPSVEFHVFEWKTTTLPSADQLKMYRFVIPMDSDARIGFENYFNNLLSINDKLFSGVRIRCCDKEFLIYQLNSFFIVECESLISYEHFDQNIRSILASFGFVTGYVPMGYGYLCCYNSFDEKICGYKYASSFLKTYKTSYCFITMNAYELLAVEGIPNDEEIRRTEKKLRPVSTDVFAKLCDQIISDENFANAIYSVLEANRDYNSVQSRAVSYSVILEILTNIITSQNEDKVAFITDKKIQNQLRGILTKTASEFCSEQGIADFDNSPIKKRIDNICAPTNRDKLLKPFEIMNLKISAHEIDIVSKRNDFLHGNNFLQGRETQEAMQELYYIGLELSFLAHALIFKYVGYSGCLKNLSKHYLKDSGIDQIENEPYFREI